MAHLIAPSVLAANFLHLHEDIEMVNGSEADWLHVDIMDGQFVPNISFGPAIVQEMSTVCAKPLDVHLMLAQPDDFIQQFQEAGAFRLTVHVEACTHLHRSLQKIQSLGLRAGVALNPHTPVSSIVEVLDLVDLVCVMSVNPGYGGQKFIYRSLHKIEQLREEIITRNLDVHIEVDGGVGLHNAERILQAGADVLVAGSSVFGSDDPQHTISRLKSIEAVRSI